MSSTSQVRCGPKGGVNFAIPRVHVAPFTVAVFVVVQQAVS